MTGEELGRILGDAVNELQSASMEIEATVDSLLDIDGKAILLDEADDEIEPDQPYLTIGELGELIGDALNELESVTMVIENASGLLQSIGGNALTASASDGEAETVD